MNDEFKERFNYLMSLSNKDLRKEIENSNWVFILQELRYAGETIEAYESMRKEAIEYIKNNQTPISEPSTTLMKLYGKCLFEKHCEDLLNILNKVGGSDE